MTKARTLASTVSTGSVLADGSVAASEVSGLSTVATSGAYADLSGKPTLPTFPSGTIVGTSDAQSLSNKTIAAATFTDGYTEEVFTGNTSTAITLDLVNGSVQNLTLTATTTITMPTAVAGKSFIMFLRTGAGSYTVTWTTVKWPGGTAPTLTSAASKMDIFSFFSDGTNWYGTTVGQNYTP